MSSLKVAHFKCFYVGRLYMLQALVICGTELPQFNAVSTEKLHVRISIGI